jgi:hypothetical protein
MPHQELLCDSWRSLVVCRGCHHMCCPYLWVMCCCFLLAGIAGEQGCAHAPVAGSSSNSSRLDFEAEPLGITQQQRAWCRAVEWLGIVQCFLLLLVVSMHGLLAMQHGMLFNSPCVSFCERYLQLCRSMFTQASGLSRHSTCLLIGCSRCGGSALQGEHRIPVTGSVLQVLLKLKFGRQA